MAHLSVGFRGPLVSGSEIVYIYDMHSIDGICTVVKGAAQKFFDKKRRSPNREATLANIIIRTYLKIRELFIKPQEQITVLRLKFFFGSIFFQKRQQAQRDNGFDEKFSD